MNLLLGIAVKLETIGQIFASFNSCQANVNSAVIFIFLIFIIFYFHVYIHYRLYIYLFIIIIIVFYFIILLFFVDLMHVRILNEHLCS